MNLPLVRANKRTADCFGPDPIRVGPKQDFQHTGGEKMKVVRCFTWALLAIGAVGFAAAQDAAAAYKSNCAMCHGAAGDGNTPAGKKFNVPSFTTDAAI